VRLVRDGSGDRARAHLAALEVAAGRHVAWVDPACRLLPWHLAHVVEALENRPDAGMVVSPFNLSDERGQFWKRIDPLDDPVSPPAFWRAGAAVRREILTGVRPRPLVPVELALLRRLAAAGRVVGAAEPGFHVPLSAFEACRPRSAGEAALLEALERAEGGAVDLSLVVLASEGGAMLRETLDRLLEGLPGDLGLEVVIVDCGGGVAALAPPAGEIPTGGGPPAPAGSSALRIAPGVHADPVAARRAGCAAARGELLLLVEDRHEPGPGLVAAHVAAHAAARRDGGVAAVVAGETRSPADGERALLGRYLDRTGRADLRAVGRPEGRVPGLSLRSWNLSLPRALLAAAGGHDASLPDLECSDAELGRRLAGAGARFVPCPGAVVRARTQPGFEDFGRRVEEAAAARIALLARHPELLPGYRCRTLSVPVLAEIQERRRALIASLEAALRALATVDLSPLEGFAETAALAAQLGERFGTLMPVMEELWCGRGYLRGLRELDRELIEVPAAACR
jgi:hypothetical protein